MVIFVFHDSAHPFHGFILSFIVQKLPEKNWLFCTNCYNNSCTIPYRVLSAQRVSQPDEKRESGVNPERSGHCIQGVAFVCIHCTFTVWEGKRYMLICKSGNLLSTWGETSDESSVPGKKVFALCLFGVSAFGSRHFLFMECARCGTVQAAGIWILNIHFDFWSDRSWRHSACYAGKINVPHQNPSKSDILLTQRIRLTL